MKAIEVKHVSYNTKTFQIKRSFIQYSQGFVTGFIGSNGAGKTTMIRLMMDLLEPNTGEIKILGRQMKESAKCIKNKIGFVYSEMYFNQQWNIKTRKYDFSFLF